jgi:hypothetical protein
MLRGDQCHLPGVDGLEQTLQREYPPDGRIQIRETNRKSAEITANRHEFHFLPRQP